MDDCRVGAQRRSGWLDVELTASRCFSDRLEDAYLHIDRLSAHFCFRVAHEFGLCEEATIERPAWLAPEAEYLWRYVLDVLHEDGYRMRAGDQWRAVKPCPADDSLRLYQEAPLACPEAAAIFELMKRCYDSAPAFLTGKQTGVSVIFPRGDLCLWERVHRQDAVMSIYADLVPPELADVLQKGARVLEVGAGVGAVLRRCLPMLKERETAEYWFTDLGRLFVQRAEREFSGEALAHFAVLDLDQPLAPQGFAPGWFDVVLGVNVLHSARNLEFSLRELRSLLRVGGTVILGEGSPPQAGKRWRLDFVFAFLRGWWDVSLDPGFRPRPGFLFPREWMKLLRHCGYASVTAFPGEEWFRGDCRGGLVVATK